ncbi:MAG: PLL family lectin [Myxococcales bacterium]
MAIQDANTGYLDHGWSNILSGSWGWEQVPYVGTPIVSSPTITSWGTSGDFSILFAEPNSKALYEIHQLNGGGWSGVHSSSSAIIAGSLTAVSTQDITACGSDNCADVWGAYRDASGVVDLALLEVDEDSINVAPTFAFPGSPTSGEVGFVDRPALASRAKGLLDLYAPDVADSLEHFWYTSSLQSSGIGSFFAEWSGPEVRTLSVPPAGAVGSASPGPGRVDLVYLGVDGNLYHAVQAASAVPTHQYDPQRTGAKLDEVDLNADSVSRNRGQGSEQFGWLWDWTVDGDVHAEPLYVPQLLMSDGLRHNVVFVATENNSVYAFDADSNSNTPIWQTTPSTPSAPGELGYPVPFGGQNNGNGDFSWWISTGKISNYCWGNPQLSVVSAGITGTPVIDLAANLIYVVAFTGTTSTGAALNSCSGVQNPCTGVSCTSGNACNPTDKYAYNLYGLSLTDGSVKLGPVAIAGSMSGSGDSPFVGQGLCSYAASDYSSTSVIFSPTHQMQRPALLESNGIIYVAFGSEDDNPPYHGWVFAYQASNLAQAGVFLTTPSNLTSNPLDDGAIWQSGGGPAADEEGNVYVEVGNGSFQQGGTNYGDSVVRLSYNPNASPALTVSDYFTPYNQTALQKADIDLGSAGPMIWESSDPHLVIAPSKQGEIYVLQADKLTTNGGHFNSGGPPDDVLQEFFESPSVPTSSNCPCTGTGGSGFDYSWPVAWTSIGWGSYLYLWPAASPLYGYQAVDNNSYSCTSGGWPFCTQSCSSSSCSYVDQENPGDTCAVPAFTSTTTQAGCSEGGWLSLSANGGMPGTGLIWAITPDPVLHAFNALNLAGGELWNSTMNGADSLAGSNGYHIWEFTTPMVANGKVFVATGFGSSGQNPVVHVYGLKGR